MTYFFTIILYFWVKTFPPVRLSSIKPLSAPWVGTQFDILYQNAELLGDVVPCKRKARVKLPNVIVNFTLVEQEQRAHEHRLC